VPDGDHVVPIGEASVARAGEDVTLVSRGGAVHRTLAAAELLAAEHGISAEVVDLRTLSPLDTGAILRSLERTGRIAVVHDAVGPRCRRRTTRSRRASPSGSLRCSRFPA
jgi:pyruvate/2-oxoglutarate/acetoin dehydrogenase E1 component